MPEWDHAAVALAVKQLRLVSDPQRIRQGQGTRIGNGVGSSLEFHDYRSYVAGDDLRMVDWGVYARSDQLVLRRHRQEVSPRVEIFVDHSLSMGITDEKIMLTVSTAALLAELASVDGSRPQIWLCGEQARPCHSQHWADDLRALSCQGGHGLLADVRDLHPGSERFIISDGLYNEPAAHIIRRLGSGAGCISMVHILSAEEQSPTVSGHIHAIDPEGGERDLMIDQASVDAYLTRLHRLQASWQSVLQGRGAGLIHCTVEDGFDGMRQTLLRSGVVTTNTTNSAGSAA